MGHVDVSISASATRFPCHKWATEQSEGHQCCGGQRQCSQLRGSLHGLSAFVHGTRAGTQQGEGVPRRSRDAGHYLEA